MEQQSFKASRPEKQAKKVKRKGSLSIAMSMNYEEDNKREINGVGSHVASRVASSGSFSAKNAFSCSRLRPSLLFGSGRVFAVIIVFGLVDPVMRCRLACVAFCYPFDNQGLHVSGVRHSPAVPNHAHAPRLRHAIELGALLQVLLAANALSVAEACFS